MMCLFLPYYHHSKSSAHGEPIGRYLHGGARMIKSFPTTCAFVCIATVHILENCNNQYIVKRDRTKSMLQKRCTQSGRVFGCSRSEFGIRASEVVTAAAPWRFDLRIKRKRSNSKEHVHKDGAAVLCTDTTQHPTARWTHICTTITIIICGSIPSSFSCSSSSSC